MKITLTLLKAPAKAVLPQSQKSFDTQGGSIGRGDSNQWALPDPDKFLSSKHCLISCEQQQFYVTDTSTNGLFLNGASLPIGRNNKVAIAEGDTLDLGEYRLRVGIELAAAPANVASPFAQDFSSPAAPALQGSSEWGTLEEPPAAFAAIPGLASADPFFAAPDPFSAPANPFAGSPDPFASAADPFGTAEPLTAEPVDPFAGAGKSFGLQAEPFAAGANPFDTPATASPANFSSTQGDNLSGLADAFSLPKLQEEQGAIPDDFWNFLGTPEAPSPAGSASTPAVSVASPVVHSVVASSAADAPSQIPDDFFAQVLGAKTEFPTDAASSTPPQAAVVEHAPVTQPDALASLAVDPIVPPPASNSASNPGVTPAADIPQTGAAPVGRPSELLNALGLAGKINPDDAADASALAGAIVRESLGGLLQILRSRTAIKHEFRINVTTIQAKENNPIKFATDVDDALDLLFVRQSKGYKPPVESVRDSFESIMDHQVAVLAGIRAAFAALLGRFDPVLLEHQFERQGKTGGILPGMKGAKCWSAYDDYYRELMGNFENSFQNLFGDDFVQAYEEQLRKLSIARKLENLNS